MSVFIAGSRVLFYFTGFFLWFCWLFTFWLFGHLMNCIIKLVKEISLFDAVNVKETQELIEANAIELLKLFAIEIGTEMMLNTYVCRI